MQLLTVAALLLPAVVHGFSATPPGVPPKATPPKGVPASDGPVTGGPVTGGPVSDDGLVGVPTGAAKPADVPPPPPAAKEAPPPPAAAPTSSKSPLAPNVWRMAPPQRIQGNTLKTWNVGDPRIERVQLSVKSEGRPVDAKIELWQTPSYTPTKFRVYTENGKVRPIDAIIETPFHPKTVAVHNEASMDFPFDATVVQTGLDTALESLSDTPGERIQGGRITSYTFGSNVKSIQVLMTTELRNMKARIELTQGPNQVKQFIEMYASKGYKNPFYAVIQTPGNDNTVRVINQHTVEFPFDAWVLPYEMVDEDEDGLMAPGGGWGR